MNEPFPNAPDRDPDNAFATILPVLPLLVAMWYLHTILTWFGYLFFISMALTFLLFGISHIPKSRAARSYLGWAAVICRGVWVCVLAAVALMYFKVIPWMM